MLKTLIATLLLAGWATAVVVLAFARQWSFVVPLLALGGLFETLVHGAQKE